MTKCCWAPGVFAPQIVALSGLGEFDAIQLERALTGKAASVQAGPGEYSENISGSASPQDLETLFQLTYLHFTAPRNDAGAYESFMSRIRAALANRDANPQVAFSDTFAITLWQDHPRARPQTVSCAPHLPGTLCGCGRFHVCFRRRL
jgi:zinc protease